MGISGLLTTIKSIPGSSKTVNIIEEVQKCKGKGEEPVIVINLWTLANHQSLGDKEKIVGGRVNKIREDFENFLLKLQENGVKLVFVLKKAQDKESDFMRVVDDQYNSACKILDFISTLKSPDNVLGQVERSHGCTHSFPFNRDVLVAFYQVAVKFGDVLGVSRGEFKPTTVHVNLALKHKAMALMGTDTYYVFYGGDWKFWADNELDMKNMTVREYNKELILKSLGITVETAPLFVALAGGIYSTEAVCKKLYQHFKSKGRKNQVELFKKVAKFVSLQRFPLTDETLQQIVRNIFGRNDNQIVGDIRQTMDLISTKCIEVESKGNSGNELMNFQELILLNEPIYISPLFSDLRLNDMKSVATLTMPWLEKTVGVVLKDEPKAVARKMLTKQYHGQAMRVVPIYPAHPPAGLSSGATGADAGKLLVYISCVEFSTESLESIPEEHLVNFIILIHLLKMQSLKFFEAKLILQTIADLKNGNVQGKIEFPETLDERALRVNFLFTKLYFVLHSCLAAVGLKQYEADLIFDNVHFQKLFEKVSVQEKALEAPEKVNDLVKCFMAIVEQKK